MSPPTQASSGRKALAAFAMTAVLALVIAAVVLVESFNVTGGHFGERCGTKNQCFGFDFRAKCMEGKYVESPSYCTHTCKSDVDCPSQGWSCAEIEGGDSVCFSRTR